AVTHPDREALRQAGEDRRVGDSLDRRVAVLAPRGRRHLAAELVGDQLHAVADPQDGLARLEHGRRRVGRAGLVDRGRPAREHERPRVEPGQLLRARVRPDQLAVDVALADAPRDQLAVLRAEIDDRDGLSSVLSAGGLVTHHSALSTGLARPTRAAAPAVTQRTLPTPCAGPR